MKHLRYLKYLIVHKWFVMLACFRYGLYWQGIVHDWSKFLPSEWVPYANYFYGPKRPEVDEASLQGVLAIEAWKAESKCHSDTWRDEFDRAWLLHQHRNPHHWQHWVLREDSGDTKVLQMPRKYALEMLADWEGAGRAITGKKDLITWYTKNRSKIMLHPETRFIADRITEFDDCPF
jgi:hypothetical protein